MTTAWPHVSVLRDEVIAALAPQAGGVFVDCTLGMGGHTEALLEAGASCVIGIDRDADARRIAAERLARFGDRVRIVAGGFGDLDAHLDAVGIDTVDGVFADLGVSSLQLDVGARGFSFRSAGPVDMRMDATSGPSAADLIASADTATLADWIFRYGEDRFARRIAAAIVAGRPFSDTLALAAAIVDALPAAARHGRIHPATRTFQALRIVVNDELGHLERLLPTATARLRPGGRLAVLTFHSLEDRIVKRFFAAESGKNAPRDGYGRPLQAPRLQGCADLAPSEDDPNPRARSARLRVATKSGVAQPFPRPAAS